MTTTIIAGDKLRNFKRNLRLTVFRENAPLFDEKFIVERGRGDENGIIIEALKVEFDIERSLKKHPNSCSIKLTNLNDSSRAALGRKPLKVVLEAGYDGALRQMYVGDVMFGMSTQDGADWITILQLGDGDRVYRSARVNRSYPAGTSVKTVLRDCVTSVGQTLPKHIEDSKDLDAQIAGGAAIHGPLQKEMTTLLRPFGYEWSFQDGKIVILAEDQDDGGDYLISEETGMIGSPDFGTPPRNGKPPPVTIRVLLFPELRPGKSVRVQSRTLNGTFKIINVKHKGNTHGKDWVTEIEIKNTQSGGKAGGKKPKIVPVPGCVAAVV